MTNRVQFTIAGMLSAMVAHCALFAVARLAGPSAMRFLAIVLASVAIVWITLYLAWKEGKKREP